MLSHASRSELGAEPVAALAVCGKELQLESTAAAARSLLASRAVKVLPVLSGRRYVGAVDREMLTRTAHDEPVGELARDLLPVATARTPAHKALAALDARGGTRLVVLEEDGATYVGIVCLRGDRNRLCVDRDRLARHARTP